MLNTALRVVDNVARQPKQIVLSVGALVALVTGLVTWTGSGTHASDAQSIGARLERLESDRTALEKRIDRLEKESDVIRGYLKEIVERTARIEGKLEDRR